MLQPACQVDSRLLRDVKSDADLSDFIDGEDREGPAGTKISNMFMQIAKAGIVLCQPQPQKSQEPKHSVCRVVTLGIAIIRDPKGHVNIRISHAGSKAQYERDTRNHGL